MTDFDPVFVLDVFRRTLFFSSLGMKKVKVDRCEGLVFPDKKRIVSGAGLADFIRSAVQFSVRVTCNTGVLLDQPKLSFQSPFPF